MLEFYDSTNFLPPRLSTTQICSKCRIRNTRVLNPFGGFPCETTLINASLCNLYIILIISYYYEYWHVYKYDSMPLAIYFPSKKILVRQVLSTNWRDSLLLSDPSNKCTIQVLQAAPLGGKERHEWNLSWLVVSTHLKKISQIGSFT